VDFEEIKSLTEDAMGIVDEGLRAIPEEWTK
jgi:hypothetical protein